MQNQNILRENRKVSMFLLAILLFLYGCQGQPPRPLEDFLPRLYDGRKAEIQVIRRQNYILGYAEQSEQAAWVLYELLASELTGKRVERTDDFREDPLVATGSATLADYRGSGYDRGHLAPAADMAFSEAAMSESFYLSNISPQRPAFNRGIWRKLEAQVRTWARRYRRLIVVTGGIVAAENAERIGDEEVAVPEYFYKVIYDPKRQKMLAFILENRGYEQQELASFVFSVDRAEERSGLNFFFALPDEAEEAMESTANPTAWGFAD